MTDDDKESLRKEYNVCFENWRFFVGLRFTILAFFIALNSGMLYAFFNMVEKSVCALLLLTPPVIGIVSVMAGWLIENRNRKIYYVCIQRAQEIEKKFGYEADTINNRIRRIWPGQKAPDINIEAKTNYIATLLNDRSPVTISSSQTWGIIITYLVFLFIWCLLFIGVSFYIIYKVLAFFV